MKWIPAVGLLLMKASAAAANDERDLERAMKLWRPQVLLLKALKTHDAAGMRPHLSPDFVFLDKTSRAKGEEASHAFQKQFDQLPANVNLTTHNLPITVKHRTAKLTWSATTPQVNRKATQYWWEGTWRYASRKWRLVSVRALPTHTLVEPLPSPDNPAVRAEIEKAYTDYFKALETEDAALFGRVTLPEYTSFQAGHIQNSKETGDPVKAKIASLKPLGKATVKIRKLYVDGDKAVAVIEQTMTSHEKPDPKESKEFPISRITFVYAAKDTWRHTPEGWKLAKEEPVR
jgi:ketosteroid isomerase-like protein